MREVIEAIERLKRSTWDNRVTPSRQDIRTVLHALENVSGHAVASLDEILAHIGDSMDDYYAARLEEVEAISAAFEGGVA